MDKSVTVIKREIAPLVQEANMLKIETPKDMVTASSTLSQMNKIADRINEEKEKVTVPLNAALKAERARWKPVEEMYDKAITSLRAKMSAYQTEQKRIADEEAKKIEARIGEGKGKLKLETAVSKIEAIEKPENDVVTEEGIVKFKTTPCFEVVDMKALPMQYHLPDEQTIRRLMNDGKELPGVRYWNEERPINYR